MHASRILDRRAPTLLVIVAALAMAVGCGPRSSSPSTGSRSISPHLLTSAEMSPAERKYGVAPAPSPTITYQPDVVIVGGGADAIRAASSNGIEWTIDGSAPGMAGMVPGKVIFVTNRAVGRVLATRLEGANIVVTLGPVDLPEVVKDADISIHQAIDFSQALVYSAPDFPGSSTTVAPLTAALEPGGPRLTLASLEQSAAPKPTLLKFDIEPIGSKSGIGARITSKSPGLTLGASVLLHLATPTIDLEYHIADGKTTGAELVLGGAAGLTLTFEAGTDIGMKANVNEDVQPNIDLSIPFGGPLPLAITVRQHFIVKTALGVNNTTIKAVGDYGLAGKFRVGFVGGKVIIAAPGNFSTKTDMLDTLGGVSLGASGLLLSDQVKMVGGLGAFGFAAGPYFGLNSTLGVVRSSDITFPPCKSATLIINASGGVGYLIPKPVTTALNFFLRLLKVPEIKGEGGFAIGKPLNIINQTTSNPPSKACSY